MTADEWRSVVGAEDFYAVSTSGEVKSLERITVQNNRYGPMERLVRERILKPGRDVKTGRLRVQLYDGNGNAKNFSVHRLVLEAFVGPRPPSLECVHLNGRTDDNRLENLRWGRRLRHRGVAA